MRNHEEIADRSAVMLLIEEWMDERSSEYPDDVPNCFEEEIIEKEIADRDLSSLQWRNGSGAMCRSKFGSNNRPSEANRPQLRSIEKESPEVEPGLGNARGPRCGDAISEDQQTCKLDAGSRDNSLTRGAAR